MANKFIDANDFKNVLGDRNDRIVAAFVQDELALIKDQIEKNDNLFVGRLSIKKIPWDTFASQVVKRLQQLGFVEVSFRPSYETSASDNPEYDVVFKLPENR